MDEQLRKALKDFSLPEALLLTDKMHELDALRQLTNSEERLWERLTVKIERARGNTFFL